MSRKGLDAKTSEDLVRLLTFIVITGLATLLLAVTITNASFGSTRTYKAVFTDVTGLNKGDDVRIAGVKVGQVKGIDLQGRNDAEVTFTVAKNAPLDRATHATIKYRNLVGQRYIALTDDIGNGELMHAGDTIPLAQTTPALDLTALFNGFKPLFTALSPDDINKLSYEIVQVFQGEGGTLDSLLSHTASVTQTLADRNQVIDALIDNLNQVLDHLGNRDTQLSNLIVTFKTFVQGLTGDRQAILDSLDHIQGLTTQTADLVNGLDDPLTNDVKQLRALTANLAKPANKQELDRVLQVFPLKLNKIGNTATYGSWFNFYLCNFTGRVRLLNNQVVPIGSNLGGSRCNLS